MTSLIKRIPLGAFMGCAFLSFLFFRQFVFWDIAVGVVCSGAIMLYVHSRRLRVVLCFIALLGFANAFIFAGATYIVFALALAGCVSFFSASEYGAWLKTGALAFAFFLGSFDVAYLAFAHQEMSALYYALFILFSWFLTDTMLYESGMTRVSKGESAIAALLITQCAVLVSFLPFGYFAQAFCITACFLFLTHILESTKRKISARASMIFVFTLGAALWLITWISFVTSR